MTDTERLRRRLAAAGADIPDALLDVVLRTAAPLLATQERLLDLDLGDDEPFSPTRLADDAE